MELVAEPCTIGADRIVLRRNRAVSRPGRLLAVLQGGLDGITATSRLVLGRAGDASSMDTFPSFACKRKRVLHAYFPGWQP